METLNVSTTTILCWTLDLDRQVVATLAKVITDQHVACWFHSKVEVDRLWDP